jgi:hypothetical protein
VKAVKVRGEPSALKREHPAFSKLEITFLWSCLPSLVQIQIHPTKLNADPDPQRCLRGFETERLKNFLMVYFLLTNFFSWFWLVRSQLIVYNMGRIKTA